MPPGPFRFVAARAMLQSVIDEARRELVRSAARPYLREGYLIAEDDERGIALVRERRFNPFLSLILGPLYMLGWLADRDRWLFLTATDAGDVIVRRG
jgi:hypothetical protein